jgi:peptide-methionine (S)-S-oxide reductase
VGYCGGKTDGPTYESVCAGDGHTEAIEVLFDPQVVSYDQILRKFFASHMPSECGVQYRSAIWTHGVAQASLAAALSKGKATHLGDATAAGFQFWRAEEYHQHFLDKQGGH